jgi:hypothetical protein
MFIHDSHHEPDIQRHEFETALRHAAPEMALLDGGGLRTDVLRDIARERAVEHRYFREQPRDHIYQAVGTGLALFRSEARSGQAAE